MSGCTVCTHPQFDAITEALSQGVSLRTIEETHGVSRSALSRHQGHHEDGGAPPPDALDPAEASQPPAAPALATPSKHRLHNCEVCFLPNVDAVEAMVDQGGPPEAIALEHGVSRAAIAFHLAHQAGQATAIARYAREQARTLAAETPPPTSPAPLDWEELMHLAVQLHQQIEYAASAPAMVFALRNIGKLLPQLVAAMAQAGGQACPVPPGLLRPHFRPGDLPPHEQWQMRGHDEASSL